MQPQLLLYISILICLIYRIESHSHHHHNHHHDGDELCGTPPPRSASQQRLDQLRESQLLNDDSSREHKSFLRQDDDCSSLCRQCIEIAVHVHLGVVGIDNEQQSFFVPHPHEMYDSFVRDRRRRQDDESATLFKNFTSVEHIYKLLTENFRVLNDVMFADTPFRFRWESSDDHSSTNATNSTHINVDQSSPYLTTVLDPELVSINFRELTHHNWRVGDATDLNIYVGHELCSRNNDDDESVSCDFKGAAYLPTQYTENPARDGVYIRYGSLFHGGDERFSEGFVLGHEIGHWLGLYHTFHVAATDDTSDRCASGNLNDFVDDTPAHTGASDDFYDENCTRTDVTPFFNRTLPDTCPNLPGDDPVYNYMNYVKHEQCLQVQGAFTCGQKIRMHQQWFLHRRHGESCQSSQNELLLRFAVTTTAGSSHAADGIEYTISRVVESSLVSSLGTTTSFDSAMVVFNSTTDYTDNNEKAELSIDLCVPHGIYILEIVERNSDEGFQGMLQVWINNSEDPVAVLDTSTHNGPIQLQVNPPPSMAPTASPPVQVAAIDQNPPEQPSMLDTTTSTTIQVETSNGSSQSKHVVIGFVLYILMVLEILV